MLDANALWLLPSLEHPVFRSYADFFGSLFRHFQVIDYRAAYLDAGAAELERRIQATVGALAPRLLIYSQFPGSYAYISPDFLERLREGRFVVGLGFDDEIYFDQAKYFYQACSAVITSDIAGAEWLNEVGIPAYTAVTAWLKHSETKAKAEEDIPVSFVGDLRKPGRQEFIRHLEARGIEVADFGAGSRNGPLDHTGVIDVFRRSKINLNFTGTNPPQWILRHDPQRAQAKQIKGRPFELAAIGRFCLTEWASCVDHWFRPGVDIGVFRDQNDLVQQVRRYLGDDVLRRTISSSAHQRYRTELAPEVQFTRIFSRILSVSREPVRDAPVAEGGPIFYESMGRSRGVAFLHALRRGSPIRALREIFMKWSGHIEYWRGFAEAVMDTIANRLPRT